MATKAHGKNRRDRGITAKPQAADVRVDDRRADLAFWLGSLLLLLATFLAYIPALRAGFIWDDPDYVVNNPVLRSADGLWRMWLVPRSLPQYYPLVHTTFWVEYHLWGLAPAGYH